MGSISAYDTKNYAQFNPLSMQEIFLPAQQMREQHDKLAEEYAAQEQAGGLSLFGLKEGIDDEAIKIHQNYMAETKKAADELATKGFVDSGRRKNLYALKQQYNNNVVPLQNQLKIRQERAEELRKIQLQDPTFRATSNPNDISLTEGLKSPTAFNYDGVSGNQLYSTAAKKLEQLSKTINQDVPELKKMPKLSFQYFTAIQSGATPGQAANAMKREGYDPTVVDKMTNMIHGTIDSTMREFGVYDKFKGNDKVINELWDSTSQAAYNAIGTKQFGQVHDSWSEGNARLAQQQAQAAGLAGKSHQEFDASFDDEKIKELNQLLKESSPTHSTKLTEEQFYRGREASRGSIKGTYDDYLKSFKQKENAAQSKIFKMAVDAGLIDKGQKFAVKDLQKVNEQLINALQEDYKKVNKTHFFYNVSGENQQKFNAYLARLDEIKDTSGKEIETSTIFNKQGQLLNPATYKYNPKNGSMLQLIGADAKIKNVPFDINALGNPILTKQYEALVVADKYSGSNFRKDFGIDMSKEDFIERQSKLISNILSGDMYSEIKTAGVQPGIYE